MWLRSQEAAITQGSHYSRKRLVTVTLIVIHPTAVHKAELLSRVSPQLVPYYLLREDRCSPLSYGWYLPPTEPDLDTMAQT